MEAVLGHVTHISGSRLTVAGQLNTEDERPIRIGSLVKVPAPDVDVVGSVTSMRLESASPLRHVFEVDLLGEITRVAGKALRFQRGVLNHPLPGAAVVTTTASDRSVIFAGPTGATLRIGTLSNDATQPALLTMDDLLAKHFAIVGATGTGKSSAVTVMVSAILAQQPNAHIVLLDPHNEYASAFGDIADVLNVDNFVLPFWLFDLEEAVRIIVRGGTEQEQQAQAIILKDAITQARRYSNNGQASGAITVDTPVPFNVHDLLGFINEAMGRLGKPDSARPYLRLRTRLESLRDDRRYAFMFQDAFDTKDPLSNVIARLLRIPVGGKPLTILDLSGVPSEIADVVVSLSCRVIFDFTMWADPRTRPPILLVCEEAHRYVPEDERQGFPGAEQALTRIAKEGRKYGLSLGLVSQRPSEISTHALSQCGTIFALRLGNDRDQRFVAKALADIGHKMLETLPVLRTQEAIVFGEAVPLPMRVRIQDLPPELRPHSDSAQFSQAWQMDSANAAFRDATIARWRNQTR